MHRRQEHARGGTGRDPFNMLVIKQDFEGVPEDITRKIVCENAAKLYNIELN